MYVSEALEMARMILGDESESIWGDSQILGALNLSNKRIMARIVAQNPEQYLISYEDYFSAEMGDSSVAPISMAASTGVISMHDKLKEGLTTEGLTSDANYAKMSSNPIRIMRLFYSRSSDLKERIEIPLVPFDGLDERTEQQTLEYEVLSRIPGGNRIYKASYVAGTTMLYIRPIPAQTIYLKIYWAEAGVYHFETSDAHAATIHGEQRLLTPYAFGIDAVEKKNNWQFVNTPKSEAVVFDACWTLSFKDDSMRKACAQERERILATQLTPMSPSEAY